MYVPLFTPCHVITDNVYRKVGLVFFYFKHDVIDGK